MGTADRSSDRRIGGGIPDPCSQRVQVFLEKKLNPTFEDASPYRRGKYTAVLTSVISIVLKFHISASLNVLSLVSFLLSFFSHLLTHASTFFHLSNAFKMYSSLRKSCWCFSLLKYSAFAGRGFPQSCLLRNSAGRLLWPEHFFDDDFY